MLLAGNQDGVKLSCCYFISPRASATLPTSSHSTLLQDLGVTSYFTLLENIYVAGGIAMATSFDQVILLLEIYLQIHGHF